MLISLKILDVFSLVGFKCVKFQVYVGLFLVILDDYEWFWDVLDKFSLNDVLLYFELEMFDVLGFGFCCGFLGMLYMEIIQEWFEWEYDIDLIIIVLMVIYEFLLKSGEVIQVDNLLDLLDLLKVEEFCELVVDVIILVLQEYLGNVIIFCVEKCGVQKNLQFMSNQVLV